METNNRKENNNNLWHSFPQNKRRKEKNYGLPF